MNASFLEDIEIELLMDAVFKRYGYDFRHYAQASLKRRIRNFLQKTPFNRPSELIPKLLVDRQFMADLVTNISVPVTEMFRDPQVYDQIRKTVLPVLGTYPFIRIWHAGCATGEEVYSMAIMLKEEGLYSRCQIYATDLNDKALTIARNGIYSIGDIKNHHQNYLKAGGKETLTAFCHTRYESVIMDGDLKKNIVFANHNLASDASFGEVHFVMCRNVMIYFDQKLQNRVLKLFHDSLVPRGFLCLGTKENIEYSDAASSFNEIVQHMKIYQKV